VPDGNMGAGQKQSLPPLQQAARAGGGHEVGRQREKTGQQPVSDPGGKRWMGQVKQPAQTAAAWTVRQLQQLQACPGQELPRGNGNVEIEAQMTRIMIKNPSGPGLDVQCRFVEKGGKFEQPAGKTPGSLHPSRLAGQQVGVAQQVAVTGSAGGQDWQLVIGEGADIAFGQSAGLCQIAAGKRRLSAAALRRHPCWSRARNLLSQPDCGGGDIRLKVSGEAAAEV
jgi:hypothetical protein